MKIPWQKLFIKTTVWLAAEILLNLIGLDNLADYSEFIFEQKGVAKIGEVIPVLILTIWEQQQSIVAGTAVCS